MRRGESAVALAFCVLAFAPAMAEAATVEVASSRYDPALRYRAGAGEANDLTVSSSGRRIFFADSGALIEPGNRCETTGDGSVACRVPRIRLRGIPEIAPERFVFQVARLQISLNEGDDRMDATGLRDHVETSTGEAELYTLVRVGDGADTVALGETEDLVLPGLGDDAVSTGPGGDAVSASRGADGRDALDLGEGDRDSVDYAARNRPVALALGGSADNGRPGEGDSISGAEVAVGGEDDDALSGGQGEDLLIGLKGDDHLNGEGGADQLLGDLSGRGDDVIRGGTGPDRLRGGDGHDALLGGAGRDRVVATAPFFFFGRGRERRDLIRCGAGFDRARAKFKDRISGCERVKRVKPPSIRYKIEGAIEEVEAELGARSARDRLFDRLGHPLGE